MIRKLFFNDKIISLVVILNVLFFYTDQWLLPQYWIYVVDSAFTIIFCLEAIVKIQTLGWQNYWKDAWNRFDFIIILLALPSLSNLLLDENILDTSVIFVLRVFRVFRSFLLFQYIPNITRILNGVKLAFKSSLMVGVAFMIFLIVSSVLTHVLFADEAPQFFGTPFMSLYSTFRLFTIEGWYDMPEAVASGGGEALGVFARVYFAILLFMGGIIGLSLINSIFVDAMVSDNNEEVLEKLNKIEKRLQELSNNKDNGF